MSKGLPLGVQDFTSLRTDFTDVAEELFPYSSAGTSVKSVRRLGFYIVITINGGFSGKDH